MQWYKDITELDSFTYGTTSSTSFNFAYESDNLKPFEHDFELMEVPGRSDELIISNNRKRNKIINVEGHADCDGVEAKIVARNINNWLTGELKYKPLTFTNDLTSYQAIVLPGVEIVEVMEGLLSIKFQFSAKEV
ncbi:MAG: hypothetical protein ACRDB0_07020 [Paraclostridium sp.]